MGFPLTDDLRQQYQSLFDSCITNPDRVNDVDKMIARILPSQARYESVAGPLEVLVLCRPGAQHGSVPELQPPSA